MQRRGSTSSFGSGTGSVRQPFGASVQRAPSRSSMTGRSFRSPSPGGRRRLSVSSDVPPLPSHTRTGSLEGPYRVSSPEPARGGRSMSVDRASRQPSKRPAPRGALAEVPEDREQDDFETYRQSQSNYARPMSPTGSVTSTRSASGRPASASGYYYDPATRSLVGRPPAASQSALKAARLSAQPASARLASLPPAPASRPRPTSAALVPPPTAKPALSAAQLKAQHMRAGPPRTAPIVRLGTSMGRMQAGAAGSTTSLTGGSAANSTPSDANKSKLNNAGFAKEPRTPVEASAPVARTSEQASVAARQPIQAPMAKPATRTRAASDLTTSTRVYAPALSYGVRTNAQASLPSYGIITSAQTSSPSYGVNTTAQNSSHDSYSLPSPTQATMNSFNTRTAALLAGELGLPPIASTGPQSSNAPWSTTTTENVAQHNRSVSQPVNNLPPPSDDFARTQSISPARSTRFSNAPLLSTNTIHEPPARAVSPSKSALKPASIRTLSPSGQDFSDSDSRSLLSEDGAPAKKKKKSVRISLGDSDVTTSQPRNVSAPSIQKGQWSVNDDAHMAPRPALPTFGSVRGRKDVKAGRAPLSQRPLSDVYETDMAPGYHESPTQALEPTTQALEPTATVANTGTHASTMAFVDGLGLNGVSNDTLHRVEEPEPSMGARPQQQAAHAETEEVPQIAVMPATPRVDEYMEDPIVADDVQIQSSVPEAKASAHGGEDLPASRETGETPLEDVSSSGRGPATRTFLSDIVSRLRPTSDIYDDRVLSGEHESAPQAALDTANHPDAAENLSEEVVANIEPIEPQQVHPNHDIQQNNIENIVPSVEPVQTNFEKDTAMDAHSVSEYGADIQPPVSHEALPSAVRAINPLHANFSLPDVPAPAIEKAVPAQTVLQPSNTQTLSILPLHSQPQSQPEDEDWNRVKSYWSSLSDAKKKQLEQEATAEASEGASPAAIDSAVPIAPAAPLPPWPDQQYQESMKRLPPGQPAGVPMMPRTLRGPDPSVGRPSSAQGPPPSGRPPMMRPGSSGGPPGGRPPMMRPGSSDGPPGPRGQLMHPDSQYHRPGGFDRPPMMRPESTNSLTPSGRPPMMRPGSSTGSVSGRPTASPQPPLKSALKKTSAPIVLAAPGAPLAFKDPYESDDSLTQERKNRRGTNGQRGGIAMRASLRDGNTSSDRVNGPPLGMNTAGRMSMRSSMRDQDVPTLRNGGTGPGRGGAMRGSMRQSMDDPRARGGAKPGKQPTSISQPNMFRSRRGSSDDEDTGGRFGGLGAGFRSRFADSDDEDYPSPQISKTSRGGGGFGRRAPEAAAPNGASQGAALGAGTLRIGEQTTPVKAKRAGFAMGRSEVSASAPVTPARPERGSLFRRLSTSQSNPATPDRGYEAYPVPAIPDQYAGASLGTDKKGNTAAEIAAKMWEKQQKTGKSQLPIVSQNTGKKKKFQGLRKMLGITD